MWKCKKCGAQNSGNSSYCPNCGTKKGEAGNKQRPTMNYIFATALCVAVVCAIIVGVSSGRRPTPQLDAAAEHPATAQLSEFASTPFPEQTPLPTPEPTPTYTPIPVLEPQVSDMPQEKTPSADDLKALQGNAKYPNNITFPKNSSYLSAYETMYVKTSRGHSAYVYWAPIGDADHRRNHYVYEGDKVTVIARENGYSCIIWISEGISFDGWVSSDLLVFEY